MSEALKQFREQYPMYNDMPDDVLAKNIHKTFYSDMSESDFNAKLFGETNTAETNTESKAGFGFQDFGAGVAEGIPKLIGGIVGLPATINDVATVAGEAITGQHYTGRDSPIIAASRYAGDKLNAFGNAVGDALHTDEYNRVSQQFANAPDKGDAFSLADWQNGNNLADITDTIDHLKRNPTQMLGMVGESLPSFVAPIAAARSAAGYGLNATKAAIATGAGIEGSSSAMDARDRVMQLPEEVLSKDPTYQQFLDAGYSQKQAREEVANRAGGVAFPIGAGVSAVTGKLLGAGKFEADVGTGNVTGGRIAGAFRGGLTETPQEFTESGASAYATNEGVKQFGNEEQSRSQGVLKQATQGAIAGGIMGAGMGAITAKPSPSPKYDYSKATDKQLWGIGPMPTVAPDLRPDIGGNEGIDLAGGTSPANQSQLQAEQAQAKEQSKQEEAQIDQALAQATQLATANQQAMQDQVMQSMFPQDPELQAMAESGVPVIEITPQAQDQVVNPVSERLADDRTIPADTAYQRKQAEQSRLNEVDLAYSQREARIQRQKDIDAVDAELQKAESEYQSLLKLQGETPVSNTALHQKLQSALNDIELKRLLHIDNRQRIMETNPNLVEAGAEEMQGVPTPENMPKALTPDMDIRKGVMPEGFDDERITHPAYRAGLSEVMNNSTKGGGVSLVPVQGSGYIGGDGKEYGQQFTRTGSVNHEITQALISDGYNAEEVKLALGKALNGQPLGKRATGLVKKALNYVALDDRVHYELQADKDVSMGDLGYRESGLDNAPMPMSQNEYGVSLDEQSQLRGAEDGVKFSRAYRGQPKDSALRLNEKGLLWVTPDREYAADRHYGGKDGAEVVSLEVNDDANIFDYNNLDHSSLLRSVKSPLFRSAANGNFRALQDESVISFLKKNGFDGFKAIEPEGQPSIALFDVKDAVSSKQGDVKYSFAGQKAKTANLENRATAEQMLNDGVDADTVWKQTGWEKGTDGQWKWEIDDSGAKVLPVDNSKVSHKLSEVLNHPALFDAYPALNNIFVSKGNRTYISGNHIKIADVSFADKDVSAQEEKLYAEIEQIESQGKMTDELEQEYERKLNELDKSSRTNNIKFDLSSLMHEIQHAIQQEENFARGGSSSVIAPEQREAALIELEHEAANMGLPSYESKVKDFLTGKITQEEYEDYLWDIASATKENGMAGYKFELYQRLAGETEARNTQARLTLGAEARRNQSPRSTEDVARDKQIVRFDGGRAEMAVSQAVFGRTGDKPNDFITADGSIDFWVLPEFRNKNDAMRFPSKPIRLKVGRHIADHRGFGFNHVKEQRKSELASLGLSADRYVHSLLSSTYRIYDEGNGTLQLEAYGSPSGTVITALEDMGDYYHVITAYDAKQKKGKLIWSGRNQVVSSQQNAMGSKVQAEQSAISTTLGSSDKPTPLKRNTGQFNQNPALGVLGTNEYGVDNTTPKSTVNDLNQELSKSKDAKRLMNSGKVEVVQSERDLPADIEGMITKSDANGNVQGLFDPATDTTYLIADNLSIENAMGVLTHEVGVHAWFASANSEKKSALEKRAVGLLKTRGLSSIGLRTFLDSVHQRLVDADLVNKDGTYKDNEEAVAYIVEQAINQFADSRHLLSDSKLIDAIGQKSKALANFIADVISFLKSGMHKLGWFDTQKLTAGDLVAIAKGNMREVANKADTRATSKDAKALASYSSDKPTAQETADAQRELDKQLAIADKVIADNGYLTAPNGEKSNLNRLQWAQVRTPQFKVWFGDWEAVNNLEWLDNAEPVASMKGGEVPRFEQTKQLYEWVGDYWNQTTGGVVSRTDLGEIVVDKKAAKFSGQHGLGQTKAQAFYLVPEALKQGRLLGKLPEVKGKPEAFIIASPIGIGDKTYRLLMEVRHDSNMQRLYVHEAVLRGEMSPSASFKNSAEHSEGIKLPTQHKGDIYNFMLGLRELQAKGASKVVDANGEPLVTYHGAGADFNKFEKSSNGKLGVGYYFTQHVQYANVFANVRAKQGQSSNLMPAYLNIKNPLNVSDDLFNKVEQESVVSAGYDGVMLNKNSGLFEVVAYESNQIKSAIGNVGTFSDKTGDIRFSKSSNTPNPDPIAPRWKKTDELMEREVDRMRRLKQMQDMVKQKTGDTSIALYDAAMRFFAITPSKILDLKRDVERALKSLAKDGIDRETLNNYLYAVHAPERNAYIKAKNGVEHGSGLSDQQAKDIADALLAQHPQLTEHAKAWRKMLDETMKERVANGTVSQKQADEWQTAMPNYVPLKNEVQDSEAFELETGIVPITALFGTGQRFNLTGKEFKEALGRMSAAGDIVENATFDMQRGVIRAQKNNVLVEFARTVSRHKDAVGEEGHKLWTVHTKKPDDMTDIIEFMIDGRKGYIKVHDAPLMTALKGLEQDPFTWADSVVQFIKKTITAWNPSFTLINGIRDMEGALLNGSQELGIDGAKEMALYVGGAMKASYQYERDKTITNPDWKKYHELYRFTGGKTGFMDVRTIESLKKEMESLAAQYKPTKGAKDLFIKTGKLLGKGVQFIEDIGGTSENMWRLAAFRVAMEQGKPAHEAARIAKNLTVNFDRKGSSVRSRERIFLFYNAAMQGVIRMGQTLTSKGALAIVGGLFVAGFLAGMQDDEDDNGNKIFDQLSDTEMMRTIPFLIGSTGERVPIPMAYGFGFFSYLGMKTAQMIRYQQSHGSHGESVEKALSSMASGLAMHFNPIGGAQFADVLRGDSDAFMQMVSPVITDPLVSIALNRSWTGSSLYPENAFNPNSKPDSEKVFDHQKGTVYDDMAKWLSRTTGGDGVKDGMIEVTPASIETLVKGYTGGAGTFIGALATLGWNAVNGNTDLNTLEKVPVVSTLYKKGSDKIYYDAFREIVDEVESAKNLAKRYNDHQADGGVVSDKAVSDWKLHHVDALKNAKNKIDSIKTKESLLKKQLKDTQSPAERAKINAILTDYALQRAVIQKEVIANYGKERAKNFDKD